jgi:hypothetical protein
MTRITVFHNISRDASFGLNTVFSSEQPFGSVKETESRAHELVKVFEFDMDDLLFTDESRYLGCQQVADRAFRAFNISHEPGVNVSERERSVALAYRARRLRSLSKGDVLRFSDFDQPGTSPLFYACASAGWDDVAEADLNVIADAHEAERLVRERFDFGPAEELAITVAWTEG